MLAYHAKGNYVLGAIMNIMKDKMEEFIVSELIGNLRGLARDQYGICLLNKAIVLCKDEDLKAQVVDILTQDLLKIVQNPYGNYAVSTVVDSWDEATVEPIMDKLKEHFAQLAIQKFSSNVIEKCVERADEAEMRTFFQVLLQDSVLKSMIKNSSSFFVVQKVFHKLQSQEDKETLKAHLEKNMTHVSDKSIRARCQSLLKQL